jgi:ferredoxin-NADP reductase
LERTAIRRRLTWQQATVVDLVDETAQVRSIVLELDTWPGHRAGQHVDVRLTAQDGYQAQRSYSIASAPEDEHLELTVERLEDGEVSSYLVGVLQVGDALELRGPIGGYFVWEARFGGPLFLVGGGSGIVPLRSMLCHRKAIDSEVPARLLYSARSWEEIIYRDELTRKPESDGFDVRLTLTRRQPEGWKGYSRRIDRELLADVAFPPDAMPRTYVCGPTGFVETAAQALVDLGHPPSSIRTERFGPT